MAKNKISDLRDHLFATLESLADTQSPMEIDRAKAISEVAQTIINSAKLEVEMVKVTDKLSSSSFFHMQDDPQVSKQLTTRTPPTI